MEDHKRSGLFLMLVAMIVFMAQTYTNATPLPLVADKSVEQPNKLNATDVSDVVKTITKRSASFGASSHERLRYDEETYFPAELPEKAHYNGDAERLAEPIPEEYSRVAREEEDTQGRDDFVQIMNDAQQSLLSTSDALARIVEYLKPDDRYEPRWPERNDDNRYEPEWTADRRVDRYNEPRWESDRRTDDRYPPYEPEWSNRRFDPSEPEEWSEGRRMQPIESEWFDRGPVDDRYRGENEWYDRRFDRNEPQWPDRRVNDPYEAEWRPANEYPDHKYPAVQTEPELYEYEHGNRRKGGLIDNNPEYNGHGVFKSPKVTPYGTFDEDCGCEEIPENKGVIGEPGNPLKDIFRQNGLEKPVNLTGTATTTEGEKSTAIPASPIPNQIGEPFQFMPADGPTEIKTTDEIKPSPLPAGITPIEPNEETPVKSPHGAQLTPAASIPNTNAGTSATENNPEGKPTDTTNDTNDGASADDPSEKK